MDDHESAPAGAPFLRVVRGELAPEEIAALVAALTLTARSRAARGASDTRERPASAWRDRSRLTRPALHPGPGAWRASAWPR
ncbi:acyl-CoA carboxylase subunit epsilon [Allonocardiopsis opalescens]|uniref:Acyl-CoA carboxylase epsilon subunit-like protein n=1 Tax=Allonocardiopsis opalescens TaxID=1144618 RepID=A0A2T0QC51_9ACTN|nr:acyl-CoA carboxylase subunit epsilon [Allonocardiopsis opalescens]PRY01423.1 acyl-CoA carboxylase epsilon subunit-like protein [Allonocardiopsis opalescens]